MEWGSARGHATAPPKQETIEEIEGTDRDRTRPCPSTVLPFLPPSRGQNQGQFLFQFSKALPVFRSVCLKCLSSPFILFQINQIQVSSSYKLLFIIDIMPGSGIQVSAACETRVCSVLEGQKAAEEFLPKNAQNANGSLSVTEQGLQRKKVTSTEKAGRWQEAQV